MFIPGTRRRAGGARAGQRHGGASPGTPVPAADAAATRPQQRVRERQPGTRWYGRKARRLAQAALFAAVRGAGYALGAATSGWLLYWIAQHL